MPLLFVARTVPFTDLIDGQLYYDCREEWEGQLSSMIYSGVLFVVTFIVPFIALTFLYGSIGVKTFRHIQPGEAHTNRDRAQQRIKIKVIKMLVTLVTVFLICWAPLQIYNLVIWIFQDLRNPTSKLHEYLFYGLFFASHLLSQFHTFLNPFIYCYMSNNFSVADLRSILDKRLPKSCYEKPVQRRSSFEFRARTGTPSTTKTQFSINNSVL
ncbi:RYamide receptor-like [Oppia nitens]|uniref:RYamide receptor-like n=1 Tax=Oppia nitens TaxID=1686743 RepID=UPI0023DABC37|nr:RYamide receptor-like [Oppia nitens]